MLAGSLQQAVLECREKKEDIERVIIHFYKEMNKREADVIKKALSKMNISVPVIIITVFKSGSTNFLLMDTSVEHRLPLSGTYVRCGATQFLLSNNTRYADRDSNMDSYPFPLKIQFDVADTTAEELNQYLSSQEWVGPLMEQLFKFSRLNWRNLKLMTEPVTLTYSELIAKAFPYMNGDQLHNYHRSNLSLL